MSTDLFKISAQDINDEQSQSVVVNDIELSKMEPRDRHASVRLSVLNPQLAKKLQKFDTSNDGSIELSEAIQALVTLQKQSNNYKKMLYLIIPLCILILASVFGVTILALKMMKDTGVSNGSLVDMSGNVLKVGSADMAVDGGVLKGNDGAAVKVMSQGGTADLAAVESFIPSTNIDEYQSFQDIYSGKLVHHSVKTFQDANPATFSIGSNVFELQSLEKVGFLKDSVNQVFSVSGVGIDVGTTTIDYNKNIMDIANDGFCYPQYQNLASYPSCTSQLDWAKCQSDYPIFFQPGNYTRNVCNLQQYQTVVLQSTGLNTRINQCWSLLETQYFENNFAETRVDYSSVYYIKKIGSSTCFGKLCGYTGANTIESSENEVTTTSYCTTTGQYLCSCNTQLDNSNCVGVIDQNMINPSTYQVITAIDVRNKTKITDIGKNQTDSLFAASQIFRRDCPSCVPSHQVIYYKRISPIPSFLSIYDLFYNWHSNGNILNRDFLLFSSLKDLLQNRNPWVFCNYNIQNVGFPADCGSNANSQYVTNPILNLNSSLIIKNVRYIYFTWNPNESICYSGPYDFTNYPYSEQMNGCSVRPDLSFWIEGIYGPDGTNYRTSTLFQAFNSNGATYTVASESCGSSCGPDQGSTFSIYNVQKLNGQYYLKVDLGQNVPVQSIVLRERLNCNNCWWRMWYGNIRLESTTGFLFNTTIPGLKPRTKYTNILFSNNVNAGQPTYSFSIVNTGVSNYTNSTGQLCKRTCSYYNVKSTLVDPVQYCSDKTNCNCITTIDQTTGFKNQKCTYDKKFYGWSEQCFQSSYCPINYQGMPVSSCKCQVTESNPPVQNSLVYTDPIPIPNLFISSSVYANARCQVTYKINNIPAPQCFNYTTQRQACNLLFTSTFSRQRLSIDFGSWYIYQSNVIRDYNFDWSQLKTIPSFCSNSICDTSCQLGKWCAYIHVPFRNDSNIINTVAYVNSFLNGISADVRILSVDVPQNGMMKSSSISNSMSMKAISYSSGKVTGYLSSTSYKSTSTSSTG